MSKKDGRTRVLFVCIGNACRSPMAEAIERLDAPDAIEAFSAGWARARVQPTSPILVNLNRAYDGIAFNISEHGLALSSAMTFPDGPLHNMRIQFPGFQSWIEISGQIEWKSKSNKTVGVRFDGLTEEAYRQIRSWISSQASAGDFQEQTERICEERNPRAPRPGNMIPGSPTSRSLALPVTPPKTYPGTRRTRKRSDKKAFQSRSKFARDQSYPGMPSPRWGDFAAIRALVGLISLSTGWRAMRRDVRSEMREPVTQKAKESSEAVRSGRPPSVSRIPIAPDPGEEQTGLPPRSMAPPFSEEHERIPNTPLRHQGQQVRAVEHPSLNTIPSAPNSGEEKMDLQARSVEPLLTMKHERIPSASLKNPDQQVRSVKRPPANTNIKTASRPVISVLAQGQTPKEPSRAAAIVNNPSVEKAEPQPVGSLPATPPHLEAPIAPPVILALNPPTVDPKKIEGSTPPANHPAIPAKTTGAVAILADPYPSLS